MRLWIVSLFTCLLLASAGLAETPKAKVNEPAPDFSWRSGRNTYKMSGLKHKAVGAVIFWSTTSEDDKEALKALAKIADAQKNAGVSFVLVNMALKGDSQSAAANFLSKEKITLPLLYDGDKKVQKLYNIMNPHTLVLVDHEGIVRTIMKLPMDTLEDRLQALTSELQRYLEDHPEARKAAGR